MILMKTRGGGTRESLLVWLEFKAGLREGEGRKQGTKPCVRNGEESTDGPWTTSRGFRHRKVLVALLLARHRIETNAAAYVFVVMRALSAFIPS